MVNYQQLFDALLQQSKPQQLQIEKEQQLLSIFNQLHQHHQKFCAEYQSIVSANQQTEDTDSLATLPFLAVRLFKQLSLKSIAEQDVFKTLQSSGTAGQQTARIYLDKDTSSRQSKVLVKILQQYIGKQRLPMLIIDSPEIVKKPEFSARAAGIQGLAFFGRDHTYALDAEMQPNWPVIDEFCKKYSGKPVLIFGFTFMLWLHFIQALKAQNKTLDLAQGVLLHSGGWKKLEQQKVSNQEFKQAIKHYLGLTKVHNFYGMAEQVGSVFVECSAGHLHTSNFAELIVRNPYTLQPAKTGEQGLVQVLSTIPTSYPGFSLLTEDLGRILGIDDCPCGQSGKYFTIDGRLPKTEVRGCSDTHQPTKAESVQ